MNRINMATYIISPYILHVVCYYRDVHQVGAQRRGVVICARGWKIFVGRISSMYNSLHQS